jgi:hypothetical protein
MNDLKLSRKVILNLSLDWRKEKINKFERAYLLKQFLESEEVSIRSAGVLLDISKSTLEDWLLWNKIGESEYQELINQGVSHTDIYRSLRDNKQQVSFNKTALEINLDRLLNILEKPIDLNLSTVKKIGKVQNILKRLIK